MAHVRRQLRNAAEASLPGAAPSYAFRKGAVFSVSADDLPESYVLTPETERRKADTDSAEHGIETVVVLRRVAGTDAFDTLDDDATAAEAALTAALRAVVPDTDLVREDQVPSEVGSARVAVHQMTFRSVATTPDDDPETLN